VLHDALQIFLVEVEMERERDQCARSPVTGRVQPRRPTIHRLGSVNDPWRWWYLTAFAILMVPKSYVFLRPNVGYGGVHLGVVMIRS
jgi:hypothetical protein